MARYLVLFKAGGAGDGQGGEPMPDEHRTWLDWKDDAGDAIVDFGAPTTALPGGGGDVIGYSIVQADSPDSLDAIFETNPHRLQGGIIELHQIVEMAGE